MRKRLGFTLAELLIVVAILAVLVGVSIPIFSTQTKKARVATNKANIRAARTAATAKMYDDMSAGKFKTSEYHAYYTYDIKSGTITKTFYGTSYETTESTKLYTAAMQYEVCTYIMIYVEPTASTSEGTIQTAPYYTEESGDLPAFTYNSKQNPNYYGPDPGGVEG
jgi:prepilin-type N-terminal cleavage/methylation domain-containing protein